MSTSILLIFVPRILPVSTISQSCMEFEQMQQQTQRRKPKEIKIQLPALRLGILIHYRQSLADNNNC